MKSEFLNKFKVPNILALFERTLLRQEQSSAQFFLIFQKKSWWRSQNSAKRCSVCICRAPNGYNWDMKICCSWYYLHIIVPHLHSLESTLICKGCRKHIGSSKINVTPNFENIVYKHIIRYILRVSKFLCSLSVWMCVYLSRINFLSICILVNHSMEILLSIKLSF